MTKNKFFKSIVILSLLTSCALFKLSAQVTVGGNTQPKATLDVVATKTDGTTTEGIIAPRLTGDQIKAADLLYGDPQNAAIVYATAPVTTPSPKTTNIKKAGYYYYDAPNNVWVGLNAGNEVWFYMPSFNLPLGTTPNVTLHFNLYDEYKKQFMQAGNAQFISSTYALNPTRVLAPEHYEADELDYYVTAYSANVITVISIDATGDMTYKVNSLNVPDGSFINVVFKVR